MRPRDRADRVDVALHEVPAEAVLQADGALEVDGVARRERADARAVEGLGDRVGGEPTLTQLDDGEATTVHRDRRADRGVVEHVGRLDLDAHAAADRVHAADGAQLLDDAGEHQSCPSTS